MNYIVPYNNYVILTPNGNVIGFLKQEECIDYVTNYELVSMLKFKNNENDGYFDFYDEQDQKDFGTMEGVYNGDCLIYSVDDLIEAVREANIFQVEKDEIIKQLLKKNINLNIYDLGIDNIVLSVDARWNM